MTAAPQRNPGSARWRHGAVAILAVLWLPGCIGHRVTLYAHNTLEGAFISPEGLKKLSRGQSEAEVVALIGAPLSRVGDTAEQTWRYFDRANPIWCDSGKRDAIPPVGSLEVFLTFKEGVLVHAVIKRSGAVEVPDEPLPIEGGA